MPSSAAKSDLLNRLNNLIETEQNGFAAGVGEQSEIILDRRGHVKGFWRCQSGHFDWTPAGYNEPSYSAADIDAVLAYTRTAIFQR